MVAAALTYTTLLALVPLLTITVLVFHNFPAFEEIGASLHDFLSANLLPEAASRLVTLYTREFIANSTQLSVIGILMLIVTALLLLATIESALNRIWRIRRPRSPGARLVTYWFVLTAGPLLLGFGVYLTTRLARESLQLAGMGALRHPLHLLFADLDFLMDPLPARPPSSRASTPRHARRLRHHAGLPARTARICPFRVALRHLRSRLWSVCRSTDLSRLALSALGDHPAGGGLRRHARKLSPAPLACACP